MPDTKGAVNPHLLNHVQVGDEVQVWWPLDRKYYSGRVEAVIEGGRHRIAYEDGDVEDLVLASEQWRFTGAAAQRVSAALRLNQPPNNVTAETSAVTDYSHSNTSPNRPSPNAANGK